ncbi:MAG: transglycosylase family protein [Nocardioides sp.]|uniref:transglycosylase family protein n=1 Tax=Nocardioides sp. TaxID=35761 RepID=UPI003F0EA86A
MRSRIAALSKSKPVLTGVGATIALALVGTTLGYQTLSKDVTLTLDGEASQVVAMGGTVGDVLADEGIEITDRDLVAPSLDEEVSDGSRITVQFGRPLELEVDGKSKTYWVNSTDVASALSEIGRRFTGAALSTSRSAAIGRGGMSLEVVTPKKLTVKIAAAKSRTETLSALTVADVLAELDVEVEGHDKVKPSLDTVVSAGDTIVFTDIRKASKSVEGEAVPHAVVKKDDASMFEGETEVVREGVDGLRDVTYRVTFRNGELVRKTVVTAKVLREPVAEIVRVGTKEQPSANYAGGSTVWDRLAQCESGGNWATNTGNGYYGGLQFSASTWAAVGGTGLPHQHSREEQIKRGQILQARAGWGQWPHCASQLGLI